MPAQDSNRPDDIDLGDAIAQVEESLFALKERYAQVQQDRERRSHLQQQQQQLQEQSQKQLEIQAELQHIQQQIDTLEVQLESRLFRWRSFGQPFWQAVRFGGLGIIIGWLLKSYSG